MVGRKPTTPIPCNDSRKPMTNLDIGRNPQKINTVGVGTAKMGVQRSIVVNATYASA